MVVLRAVATVTVHTRRVGHYSGFNFRPHMRASKFFVPEGPQSHAGSRAGRLGLPQKVPVAVLRIKTGVELRPGRAGGWSQPMRKRNFFLDF